jgi:copper transport protein
VLSGIALVTIAVTSHAAASGPEAYALLRLSTDALHLLTAGFWIGGLWVLLDLGLRGRREKPQLLFRAVSLFADVAIYGVTALFLAGMLNTGFILSAQHVDAWYGVLLALKVVLAFAMIGIAFVNRLRVTPRLASGEGGEVLARNVRGELVLGAAVVAIAAVLGSISPG